MKLEKIILNILLNVCRPFMLLLPIKMNKVTFISLTSKTLSGDFKAIYNELSNSNLDIHFNLVRFEKTVPGKLKYLFNCFIQLYEVYTSHVIVINDNNYVISKFKRKGVCVVQIWHACGAIKKFGNQIKREYPIQNYDYVISCSDVWKPIFSEAFDVKQNQIIPCGLPRIDALCMPKQVRQYREEMMTKYPVLRDSYVYLYAPTFRGNIIGGLHYEGVPLERMMKELPENSVIMYKMHPLLGNISLGDNPRILNMNEENLNALLCVTDCLISDYSSVIFDYSIIGKQMIFYAPDLDNYNKEIGLNVNYDDMPGDICLSIETLLESMKKQKNDRDLRLDTFRDMYFYTCDGKNSRRIAELILKAAGEF
ncbi:MAG: CDP-glycerol--glycerophosphate glycerophosphotransferase [Erysipelotrichaceae bacterium]|nr:CDP-glycerol--glycerophosphate glycerophosphotransferase [Erysipelotrichaceae bacterium]